MLLLAGVFTVLLCVSALAAGEGMYDVTGMTPEGYSKTETVTIKGEEKTLYVGAEKVTLTYDKAVKDSYYLVLALNDDTGIPTVSNIAYINQDTATGTEVSFTVYPNKLENDKTYTVYLSSNDGTLTTLTKQGSFSYYVPYILGDVTGEETINSLDALWVLQYAAQTRELTATQLLAANVAKSGPTDTVVNALDALWILQASAGLRVLE